MANTKLIAASSFVKGGSRLFKAQDRWKKVWELTYRHNYPSWYVLVHIIENRLHQIDVIELYQLTHYVSCKPINTCDPTAYTCKCSNTFPLTYCCVTMYHTRVNELVITYHYVTMYHTRVYELVITYHYVTMYHTRVYELIITYHYVTMYHTRVYELVITYCCVTMYHTHCLWADSKILLRYNVSHTMFVSWF